MKRFFLFVCLVIAGAVFAAGCSSDSDDSNPTNTTGNGSMSAKVNNAAWSATTVQAVWTSNVLNMGGAQISGSENRQINIGGMIAATGKYSLNPFSGIVATYSFGSGTSVTSKTATSGELNVTSLSSSGAKGTFNFQTDGYGVTEGTFDVKFK